MRRLNSLLCESPWPGRDGIERAGGHFVGQERAHLVAQRVAFGRQADLVEGEARGHCSVQSARRDQRPEFFRAARRDPVAERDRPVALVAEVVAPGEHAQRVAMQDVLAGEADRAVHLMRDRGAFLRGLGGADFRGGRFEEDRVVERLGCARSRRRPNARRSSRPTPRRRAARDCAAPPGISRSAARTRRARWHSAPSCRGSPRSAPAVSTARTTQPISIRAVWSMPSAGAIASGVTRSNVTVFGRLAREVRSHRQARHAAVSTSATDAPASTARCFASRANGTPRARPLRVPSAFSVIVSPGRAGATDIAPCGAVSPARDNSQPASSVSASGMATA